MEEVDGADSKQYRWDAKGRLAEERLNGSATPFRSYEWSVDDRLLAVVLHAEATGQNAPPRITYGYDHAGTRVARSALPASVVGEAMPPALRRAQAYLTDYNNPTGYAQSLQEIDPEERDLAVDPKPIANLLHIARHNPCRNRSSHVRNLKMGWLNIVRPRDGAFPL